SDEIGHPRHRWRALLVASMRASSLGFFVESDRYVTEVAQLAGLVDEPATGLALAMHDVMREITQRRGDRLRSALERLAGVMNQVMEAALFHALIRALAAARDDDVEGTRAQLAVIGAREDHFFAALQPAAILGEVVALAGTEDQRRRLQAELS